MCVDKTGGRVELNLKSLFVARAYNHCDLLFLPLAMVILLFQGVFVRSRRMNELVELAKTYDMDDIIG